MNTLDDIVLETAAGQTMPELINDVFARLGTDKYEIRRAAQRLLDKKKLKLDAKMGIYRAEIINEEVKMEEKDAEFKVGDVVRCKSGGPKMTIVYVSNDQSMLINCGWFNQNTENNYEYKYASFHAHAINKVPAREKPLLKSKRSK